jgi:hypothetical protein
MSQARAPANASAMIATLIIAISDRPLDERRLQDGVRWR